MVVPKGWRSVNGEQFSRLPDFSYFADVPSHSCLENRVAEGTGSYQIIHQYLQEHPQAHEKIAAVLPYFDSRHFVSQIKNPVFASVGSHDPICPMKDFSLLIIR